MRQSARQLLPWWALSRLLLLVVAVAVMTERHRSPHDILSGWDVAHFEGIATAGYANPIDRAFFPGLPLLLRAAHTVGIPMGLAGVVIAGVCSFLAALALLRLGGQVARTPREARIVGPVAAVGWLMAPTTVFTSVAYTEAPFCAAAFWAWQRGTERKWGQAAALAALACTFRVSGLFLIGGLGLMALLQRGAPVSRRLVEAATVALASLALVAYVVYLHHLTGSWNAWFEAQQAGWNRGFNSPLDALRHTLDAGNPAKWPGRPDVAKVFHAEVFSMFVGCVATLLLLWRRRWAEAAYIGVQVFAFATSYWFMSVNRAVLLWFSIWLLVGELAAWAWGWRRSRSDEGLPVQRALGKLFVVAFAVVSTLVMLWWAWQYYAGGWAS